MSAGGSAAVVSILVRAFFMAAFLMFDRTFFKVPAVLPPCATAVAGGVVVADPTVSLVGRPLAARFVAAFSIDMAGVRAGAVSSVKSGHSVVSVAFFIAAFVMTCFMVLNMVPVMVFPMGAAFSFGPGYSVIVAASFMVAFSMIFSTVLFAVSAVGRGVLRAAFQVVGVAARVHAQGGVCICGG